MEELKLRQVQSVSLEILQAVHDFCISNGITYSLAYGTLIGAIRHKGFIPWDDDIDIIMPRPDYEKFCHSFNKDGLGLASEYDEDSFMNFCKVYDINKTIGKEMAPFTKRKNTGVTIDVFPIDSVSDSFEEFSDMVKEMYPLWRRQIRYRYSKASLSNIFKTFPIKDICILLAIKFTGTANKLIKKVNGTLRTRIKDLSWGSTGHWSQLVILDDGTRNYQENVVFSDTIDMQFEDRSFKCMNGYHEFLTKIYGNYMELPPEEERIPKHTRSRYYWK